MPRRRASAAVDKSGTSIRGEASSNLVKSFDGLKNARTTMGKRYPAFNRPLNNSTASKIGWPVSVVPWAKNHLLRNPPIGGKPANPKEPTAKAAIVIGI